MNRYEFTITIPGYGKTPEEGWKDAMDTVYGDSHFDHYDESEIETKITEENIDY